METLFQEPHEKGSEEFFGPTERGGNRYNKLIYLIFIILTLSFILGGVAGLVANSEWWQGSNVVEREGVLYYPDGNPVRNYEQLNLYLNSDMN